MYILGKVVNLNQKITRFCKEYILMSFPAGKLLSVLVTPTSLNFILYFVLFFFLQDTMTWSKPAVNNAIPLPRSLHSATTIGKRFVMHQNELYIFLWISPFFNTTCAPCGDGTNCKSPNMKKTNSPQLLGTCRWAFFPTGFLYSTSKPEVKFNFFCCGKIIWIVFICFFCIAFEEAFLQASVNSLHPSINVNLLFTALRTFPMVLTGRFCVTVNSFFSWWSFPLFSWP